MRWPSHIHMRNKARQPKHFVLVQYFIHHFRRTSHKQRPLTASPHLTLLPTAWRPSSVSTNSIHLRSIVWKILVCNCPAVFSDQRMRVDAYLKLTIVMAMLLILSSVEVKQWHELPRIPSNNGHHQGESQSSSPLYRSRCSSHRNPNRQIIVLGPGQHFLIPERRTYRPTPIGDLIFIDLEQQV